MEKIIMIIYDRLVYIPDIKGNSFQIFFLYGDYSNYYSHYSNNTDLMLKIFEKLVNQGSIHNIKDLESLVFLKDVPLLKNTIPFNKLLWSMEPKFFKYDPSFFVGCTTVSFNPDFVIANTCADIFLWMDIDRSLTEFIEELVKRIEERQIALINTQINALIPFCENDDSRKGMINSDKVVLLDKDSNRTLSLRHMPVRYLFC